MDIAMDAVGFGILGNLEGRRGGHPLELGPAKQRTVLGLLLCRANHVVSVAALSEALWDDAPPRTAHKNLQVYLSAIRRLISSGSGGFEADGAARLVRRAPGYVLQIAPDQLDALRFQELAAAGRLAVRGGDAVVAAGLLGRAIGLWRGPALPELVSSQAIAAEADRLYEHYLAAYEDWAETKLRLGQHTDIVDAVEHLVRRHPFRERLMQAQMLALYRSGRQAEALARFDSMRQRLAGDLGLDPSPVLLRLYEAMLGGEQSATGRLEPTAPTHGSARLTATNTLPRDISDFTGRTDEVRVLLDTLSQSSRSGIMVVNGPAGAGKTALVVRCAHQLADRFPDGRILVSLRGPDDRPRSIGDVLGNVLRGLGMTGALPAGSDERAALLRESTAARDMLLILDDAATEAQVRSLLAATPEVVTVVTSRRYLGGLESAVHLAVGALPESVAVQLLGRLIGRDRILAEPSTAAGIVAACDRLPLALRIVGAKLALLRHVTLSQYIRRLDDEQRLLDEFVVGDLEVRSRLAAWHRDLSPQEQTALSRLASLSDTTFTVDDAAVCLGLPLPQAEEVVERLIEAHLVQADAGEVEAHSTWGTATYSLPGLVRVFARQAAGSR
jgi:DNA-binding SARP family transcriptional activator